MIINKKFIEKIIKISRNAGDSILETYESNFKYEMKDDNSPLTKADIDSHNIIKNGLNIMTPEINIISEEESGIPFKKRKMWNYYWLVDPLDGTKEFIKRNGEFTVNIALIKENFPILGVVHCPTKDLTYWGSKFHGSFIKRSNKKSEKISTSKPKKINRIISSRSHKSQETDKFIEKVGKCEIITAGSSLKFCLVASGAVDLYLRFGPTSEWDVAAGVAVVEYAGGYTCDLNGKKLLFNLKESYLNQSFISNCSKAIASEALKVTQNI